MIVVTGASGKLGRLVSERLLARVPAPTLTLASRHPDKLADLAAKGARTLKADFDDPASLAAAFAGAETVLVISGEAPVPVRIRQHRAAVDAAKQAGVKRVVYTSFTDPRPESPFTFAAIHADTESYLKASGLSHTILRNCQYAENLNNAIAGARQSGQIALPAGSGKVAYITRCDIADAIVGALTGAGHENKTYEITGPEAVDLATVAQILAQATGKAITYVDALPEAFAKTLAGMGLPPFVVEALVGIHKSTAEGAYAQVTDHAAKLAGHPIEPASAFVKRAA